MGSDFLEGYQQEEVSKEVFHNKSPRNLEAEQALLGAILLNNKTYETISEFLRPEHFSHAVHGRIFAVLDILIGRGETADPITLKAYFEGSEELEPVGGAGYLVNLAASVVTIYNVEDYGRLIYDLYIRRQVIALGEEAVNRARAFSPEETALQQVESIETKLFELASTGYVREGAIPFDKALVSAIQMAEKAYKRDSHVSGITTGFADLDRWTGGLHPSDLIILAGRPSMGKTALAMNIGYNASLATLKKAGGGGCVIFFSLEMSSEQLATRLLAQESGISSDRIRRGEIRKEDFTTFVEVSRNLSRIPFLIDDTAALTVSALRTRARRAKRKHGIDLIIIDYLQLLSPPAGKRADGRVQEISEITRSLKAIAKDLNVPILALSQLSRAVEQRDDKRPQLSDLRESGSIEQDADIVMFIYRDEYYEARKEPSPQSDKHIEWQKRMSTVYNLADLIIAKQRHGPVGTIRLLYNSKMTKFGNYIETTRVLHA
ncbi:MAG: replicative DNA helicase [Holosporales bacterium]|jgi:replicative DNA helicase|nr:replicative DNA helicase [Holosporales bacterium]